MSRRIKLERSLNRAGQRILRRRGGFHTRRGYKRQNRNWGEDD